MLLALSMIEKNTNFKFELPTAYRMTVNAHTHIMP